MITYRLIVKTPNQKFVSKLETKTKEEFDNIVLRLLNQDFSLHNFLITTQDNDKHIIPADIMKQSIITFEIG